MIVILTAGTMLIVSGSFQFFDMLPEGAVDYRWTIVTLVQILRVYDATIFLAVRNHD